MNNILSVPYTKGQISIDLENKILLLNGKSMKKQDTYAFNKDGFETSNSFRIEKIFT